MKSTILRLTISFKSSKSKKNSKYIWNYKTLKETFLLTAVVADANHYEVSKMQWAVSSTKVRL